NLINTKKLRQIGSLALDDRAGDFSAIEAEAVSRLARLMGIEVTPEMLRATGGGGNPAAYESYLKALGYLQRNDKPGNLDMALDALNGIAHSYESAGRISDAEAAYKKAIALRPDYWDGYNNLGVFYDGQSRFDEAVAQLQHAVELTPDNARVYLNLAAVYIDSGD